MKSILTKEKMRMALEHERANGFREIERDEGRAEKIRQIKEWEGGHRLADEDSDTPKQSPRVCLVNLLSRLDATLSSRDSPGREAGTNKGRRASMSLSAMHELVG